MRRREFLGATGAVAIGLGGTAGQWVEAAPAESAAAPVAEAPIDPAMPIVDAHHHLWDNPARGGQPANTYLLPQLLADIEAGGHNITDTVFVECMAMYRARGPDVLRSLGETEFVNGVAAMSASGTYGARRVAAGIIASVDMRLGERVRPILEAHRAAAGSRLKGVRNATAWDEFPVMGVALDRARLDWLSTPEVVKGVAVLGSMGMVFESWIFHTQLDQLVKLATANPHTTIILGHTGTPILVGPYAGRKGAVFADWKRGIVDLARRPNVVVKLGGLGMYFIEPELSSRKPPAGSEEIAGHWRPYIETCIEVFGPDRCMFESNFPPDRSTCSYGTLWNVFKRLAAGCSPAEKAALFSGTARRVFQLSADT